MIKLNGVGRNFAREIAVSDVSAEFLPATVTALLGANGAGKSTLLQLIAGWLPVAAGRIELGGRLLKPSRAQVRRDVMLVEAASSSNNIVSSTIIETIEDYQCDYPAIANDAASWFERLNLAGCFRKAHKALSKGQNYKVALVGLFLVRPKVWLLDEPFSCGLDANGLQLLREQIVAHTRAGGIVIFSTQWPAQAVGLTDRFMIMDQGRLVCDQPANVTPADLHRIRLDDSGSQSPSLMAVFDNLSEALVVPAIDSSPESADE